MRVTRFTTATILLATLALVGCTAQSATEQSAEPLTAPTHVIIATAEDPVPSRDASAESGTGVWRILEIDLATGDQRTLVEATSTVPAMPVTPVLSPDGHSLLYAVEAADDGVEPTFSDLPRLNLRVLDLASGETTRACEQPVRSFGWDGDDIIATTWEGGRRISGIHHRHPVAYAAPAPNAILRIHGSDVATLAVGGNVSWKASPTGDRSTGQLEFLGTHEGDLFFTTALQAGGVTSTAPFGQQVWAIRSSDTSLSVAVELPYGWLLPTDENPAENLFDWDAPSSQYPVWIARGMLPTIQDETGIAVASPPGSAPGEPGPLPRTVYVRDVADMEVRRSFDSTVTTPVPGREIYPVFDDILSRWLDQRSFDDTSATGVWLCETLAESNETTRLVSLGDGEIPYSALGYLPPAVGEMPLGVLGDIGRAGDVLYASGDDGWHEAKVPPREVHLWTRSTAEDRVLLTVTPSSEKVRSLQIVLVGATALDETER